MRIAWFSPLPPNRSGIAAYSAELLPRLAAHEIEAFIDDSGGQDAPARIAPVEGATIRGAHDFPWRHARQPYDVGRVPRRQRRAATTTCGPTWCGIPACSCCTTRSSTRRGRRRSSGSTARRTSRRSSPTAIPRRLAAAGGPGHRRPWQHPLLLLADGPGPRCRRRAWWRSTTVARARTGRGVSRDAPSGTSTSAFRTRGRQRWRPAGTCGAATGFPTTRSSSDRSAGSRPRRAWRGVVQALAQVAPALPSIRVLIVGEMPPYFDLMAEARQLGRGGPRHRDGLRRRRRPAGVPRRRGCLPEPAMADGTGNLGGVGPLPGRGQADGHHRSRAH